MDDEIKLYGKRYDEPFKKNTVEHWVKNKKSVKEVSEAMGVSEMTLYKLPGLLEIICAQKWSFRL